MMRRHFISVVMGGILFFLLAGGTTGAPGLRAADLKTISPAAPPAGGSGGSAAKAVPVPPTGSPTGSAAKAVPAPPAGVPGQPAAKTVPADALPPAPTYEYKVAGKPDPFKPFMETDPALKTKKEEDLGKKKSAPSASISPLQRLDLGQFRLLGIAGDANRRAAIVADGVTKKFYPLFVGTYIGLNGGRVAAILPDRLVVEEPVETRDKKTKRVQVRQIPVLLHKEQEEGKP
jgi:type IV pilus assembly protein PilP